MIIVSIRLSGDLIDARTVTRCSSEVARMRLERYIFFITKNILNIILLLLRVRVISFVYCVTIYILLLRCICLLCEPEGQKYSLILYYISH